jgi:uncharacterized YigZ family protein
MKTLCEEKSFKFTVLNSKFYSHIFSCENKNMQDSVLKKLRKEYPSCTHLCFASIFSVEQHSSDDGEPAGTAGNMMLSVLKSFEVINVICVVARYFGGTKLGSARLGKVYKHCAEECLFDNIKDVYEHFLFFSSCDYNTFNSVQNFCQKNNVTLEKVSFLQDVNFEVFLTKGEEEKLSKIVKLENENVVKVF